MAIAITGLGGISPYGAGSFTLIDGLLSGSLARRSRPMRAWPKAGQGPLVLSVDEQAYADVLDNESSRGLNAEAAILLASARLAIADAGLELGDGDSTGVVVSTRHAGLQDYAELFWAGMSDEVGAVSPARGPLTGLNAPAALLSIRLGARGPNMTLSNGTTGGLDALSYAVDALRSGRSKTMLVGGVEVIPRVGGTALGEGEPRSLGGCWGRPFDRHRCGPVAGEAGVTMVLERDDDARRRGARVRARVSAVASAFSPRNDLTAASRRSIAQALEACHTDQRTVVGVFAGANGSVAGDAAEALVLYELFGDGVPICAIKGVMADSAGASALTQIGAATLALERQVVPPTARLQVRDRSLPSLSISASPQQLQRGPVVVHAWDEGGCAASAILDRGQPMSHGHPTGTRRAPLER
jgi:3-oxoacyl-[acyl-carrier-protein] synthase II